MKHGSLFSGIGGFDLAAQWMGWENVFHCEWNEFGQKVLKYYWPNAISYEDITKTDFTIHRGQLDILTGGFPCQPYSSAGKRLGKEDDRHLWPEMLRAIREIKPRYVVGENVYGLINWNGGLVFEEVQADLEAEGYEVQPILVPAAAVNAPHKRDRVWFVAHSDVSNDRRNAREDEGKSGKERVSKRHQIRKPIKPGEIQRPTANSRSDINTPQRKGAKIKGTGGERITGEKERRKRSQRTDGLSGLQRNASNANSSMRKGRQGWDKAQKRPQSHEKQFRGRNELYRTNWQEFPSQSPLCSRDDGLSTRLDGITFPKWRNESIKAYGNAIVPQVAFEIFKALQETEKHLS